MVATATTQQGIDIVREFTESVFNDRDYDRITEFQSEDYVQHGPLPGMELHGSEAALETMQTFHAAFSDLEASEVLAFGDGEYVCTHLAYEGTHDGDLMGIAPTGETVTTSGTIINRIEDGQISEAWVVVDLFGILQQVGAVADLER